MTSRRGRRTAAPTSSTPVSSRGRFGARAFASAAAAGALLALAAALPARAGLFDDDEARRRIESLRQELAQQGKDNEVRIARLEEHIRNIGVVELVRQLEQINTEIARLRGQLEVLANENQQVQKRQRDFYLDLDSRLKRLESAGMPPPVPGTDPAAVAPPPAVDAAPAATASAPPRVASRDDQAREVRAYDAASNLFRRNDFASAIEAFRAFLKDYPESQLAPNASYWIGISHANLRDFRSAMAAQQEVLTRFPQSAKAPDAMLAIAAIQIEQGDGGSARNTLEDIIARYPGSEAAGKARTRLASLRR
jgi:tol-pal system protein YbgF